MLALLGAAWVVAAPHAGAQTPFYKGKRLTVLVNYAAGGPTDIEGRLFARHIAKHIDGEPNIIVQNMDGAGGIVGTSYLGEIAPKDGTMMGYLTGAAWVFANEPKKFRVDFRKYEFIAYQPGTTVYYVRTDVAPGMKEPADIVKAQGTDLRRACGRQFQGPADPPHARHARRAVSPRHRLSQQQYGAARAAAGRDQFLCRIAAGLSQRGRCRAW